MNDHAVNQNERDCALQESVQELSSLVWPEGEERQEEKPGHQNHEDSSSQDCDIHDKLHGNLAFHNIIKNHSIVQICYLSYQVPTLVDPLQVERETYLRADHCYWLTNVYLPQRVDDH